MTKSILLPELDLIEWVDREVYVIFDSDINANVRIQAAEQRLIGMLQSRGSTLYPVRLPDGIDDEKVGADDYLLCHSDDDLFDLLLSTLETPESYAHPKTLREIMDTDYPPTQWIWDKFVLEGEVNLLYADGGVGKSMLALNLAIHCASGLPFIGDRTKSTPVLILFAEDGEAEVHRRANAICSSIKDQNCKQRGTTSDSSLKKNPPIYLWCNPVDGATLATIGDTGEIDEESRLHNLRAELKKIGKPTFVVLDSLIDLFNMNEILRPPVNAALKKVLGGLCREFDCTILVLAHPSKASKSDGSHYSGSTAFNNAVRQRLTLEVVKGQENLEMGAPKALMLSVAKSNYGSDARKEIWLSGCVTTPPIPETPQSIKLQRNLILNEVVKYLDAGKRVVKNNGNHGSNAVSPKELLKSLKSKKAIIIDAKKLYVQLEKLEAKGLLRYIPSDKSKSVTRKATYEKGPNYKRQSKLKRRKGKRTASSTASSSEVPDGR